MFFVKKYSVFLIFLAGLLIRWSLIFLDYSFDVNNHIVWAYDLWQRGPNDFFNQPSSNAFGTVFPNYPPLALLIFYLSYPLQKIFHQLVWWLNITITIFPSNLIFFVEKKLFLAAMMKLTAIFADLGTAYLIYLFAKKIIPKNKSRWPLMIAMILFNPAIFYNSAYWGQIDMIPVFFVLWAAYLLLFTQYFLTSGLLFVLALLVKPTALVYLPTYLVVFIQKFGWKRLLATAVAANILFLISFVPFLKTGEEFFSGYRLYLNKIMATQSLPYVTNGAFNFWVLITGFEGIKDTTNFILGSSYRIWGLAISGLLTIVVISGMRKKTDFFYSAFLVAFTAFLFLTKMHERYSMLQLPFLLLYSLREKKYLKWFVVLSATSFLNLYHSWPVPYNELLLNILKTASVGCLISFVNILIYAHLLRQWLKR